MKKYKHFFLEDGKLVCWRVGSGNLVKQLHYSKTVTVNGLGGNHKPPASRGVWAFPYPHFDYFFVYHFFKSKLPKSIDESSPEYEEIIKKIIKKFKPKLLKVDSLYSHIFPNGKSDYAEWYYWDSVKDWADEANKQIIQFYRCEDRLITLNYAKDHLEIFLDKI